MAKWGLFGAVWGYFWLTKELQGHSGVLSWRGWRPTWQPTRVGARARRGLSSGGWRLSLEVSLGVKSVWGWVGVLYERGEL